MAIKDMPPRRAHSDGQPTNWHLNLKNVGRCPNCGARCELPCRACNHPVAKRRKLAALIKRGGPKARIHRVRKR